MQTLYINYILINDTEVTVTILSPFNSKCLTLVRAKASWRMRVDYWKLSQVLAPVEVVIPLLEQITKFRYMLCDHWFGEWIFSDPI